MSFKAKTNEFRNLFKTAASCWLSHDDMRLAAALSYYTVFSLGPLLILATAIAGLAFGDEAASGALSRELTGLVGPTGAQAVEALVTSARRKESGVIASIIGIIVLFLGASGVFTELKAAINKIWDAHPKKSTGVMSFFKDRLLSFAMVLAVGFLLLVSLVLSAGLAAVAEFAKGYLPIPGPAMHLLATLASFLLITCLFAMLFKFLPDCRVRWRDVWLGAALTSLFFSVGKTFIGLYLGQSAVLSSYGAAGSVVAVMLWAYYSSAIFFFGAELTRARAELHAPKELPVQAAAA